MREWFSDSVVEMFNAMREYSVTYKGKTYCFWQIPLEIGKYFVGRRNYAAAVEHLSPAYEANPRSKEVIQLLALAHRRLGQIDEAKRLKRILETMSDEAQTD